MVEFVDKIKTTLTSGEEQNQSAEEHPLTNVADTSRGDLRAEVDGMFDSGLLDEDDFDRSREQILTEVGETLDRYQSVVLPVAEEAPNTLPPIIQNSGVDDSEKVTEAEIEKAKQDWLAEHVVDDVVEALVATNDTIVRLFVSIRVEEVECDTEFGDEVETVDDASKDEVVSTIHQAIKGSYPAFSGLRMHKNMILGDIPEDRLREVDD